MTKSAMVRARIEPRLKDEAERVMAKVGISPTEAIRLFYRQVTLHRGLPFEVRVPRGDAKSTKSAPPKIERDAGLEKLRAEIEAAINALDAGKGKRFRSTRQLADHLRTL